MIAGDKDNDYCASEAPTVSAHGDGPVICMRACCSASSCLVFLAFFLPRAQALTVLHSPTRNSPGGRPPGEREQSCLSPPRRRRYRVAP